VSHFSDPKKKGQQCWASDLGFPFLKYPGTGKLQYRMLQVTAIKIEVQGGN
jgi:hypothetical protein